MMPMAPMATAPKMPTANMTSMRVSPLGWDFMFLF